MAREVNLVCNFFFGFVCTNLPSDTVDIELKVRTVHGIYTYRKDCTVESTIFTLWGKKVIPFPSLRRKIKAIKEDSKGQINLTWMLQIPAMTKPSQNPRKCTAGKVGTQWSNYNLLFNLIKTNRFNTLGKEPTDISKISIIRPTPIRHVSTLVPHVHSVDNRTLTLCQTNQTGQVRIRMATKLRLGNRRH